MIDHIHIQEAARLAIKGRIHSIETFGALDGPGLRYVVFMQGCPLRCLYCHNPDSWDVSGGAEKEAGDLAADILRYRNFIKSGGVTFSGGEPLLQSEFVHAVIQQLAGSGLNAAIDTSGCAPLEVCRPVIDNCGLVMLDIKALSDELCLYLTDTTGKNARALLEYCERIGRHVWIRHVLVPGLTLADWRLRRLIDYLKQFTCIRKFEPLGFHKLGEYKWDELGLDYKLTDTPPAERREVDRVRAMFADAGIPV